MLLSVCTSGEACLEHITSFRACPRTETAKTRRACILGSGMGSTPYWMLLPLHICALGYICKVIAWVEIPKATKNIEKLLMFIYADSELSFSTHCRAHFYQFGQSIHAIRCLNDMPSCILIYYSVIIVCLQWGHCLTLECMHADGF